jgi:hypothetical protein
MLDAFRTVTLHTTVHATLVIALAACGGGGDSKKNIPSPPHCTAAERDGTTQYHVVQVTLPCAPVPPEGEFDPTAAFDLGPPLIEDLNGEVLGAEAAAATHPDDGSSLLVSKQRDTSGDINVFATAISASGELGDPVLIGLAQGRQPGSLRIKYGPKGKAIAIWHQNVGSTPPQFEVVARVHASGQWGPAVRISQGPDNGAAADPDITFDTAGDAVAVWSEYGDAASIRVRSAAFRDMNSAWEAPKLVFESAAGLIHSQLRIAMLTAGPKPDHLVLAHQRLATSGVGKIIAYRCAPDRPAGCQPDGVEGGAFLPSQEGAALITDYDLGSNGIGDVVVVWRQYALSGAKAMMVARSRGLTSWHEAQEVTTAKGTTDLPEVPQIHVAANGVSLLGWSQRNFSADSVLDEEDGVFVKRFVPGPTGAMVSSPKVALATRVWSNSLRLSVTNAGHALAVWNSSLLQSGAPGLLSSTFDGNVGTPSPSPATRVDIDAGGDPYAVSLSRDADGKGVLLWMEMWVDGDRLISQVKGNRYK